MIREPRWAGEKVQTAECPLGNVVGLLPQFRRASLSTDLRVSPSSTLRTRVAALMDPGRRAPSLTHGYLDAIVRLPDDSFPDEIPVALVSKQYSLIQHRELVLALSNALKTSIADAESLGCSLTVSEYGGRMQMRVFLPSDFKAPDGEDVQPTIECLNSVDRSRPLQIFLGWYRLVCTNGLVIGQHFSRLKRRHVRSLELEDVPETLEANLQGLRDETHVLEKWWSTEISDTHLQSWIDSAVAKTWGVQAAVRVLHIARTGRDARLADGGARHRLPASGRAVHAGNSVPGSKPPNQNAYRIAQVLAFIAGTLKEIESHQKRLSEIPELMRQLTAFKPFR